MRVQQGWTATGTQGGRREEGDVRWTRKREQLETKGGWSRKQTKPEAVTRWQRGSAVLLAGAVHVHTMSAGPGWQGAVGLLRAARTGFRWRWHKQRRMRAEIRDEFVGEFPHCARAGPPCRRPRLGVVPGATAVRRGNCGNCGNRGPGELLCGARN